MKLRIHRLAVAEIDDSPSTHGQLYLSKGSSTSLLLLLRADRVTVRGEVSLLASVAYRELLTLLDAAELEDAHRELQSCERRGAGSAGGGFGTGAGGLGAAAIALTA